MHHSCICDYICTMEFTKLTAKLDNIGMTASTLCAIHCALVPIFITVLPLIGLGFLANPWFEWGMIILAFIIGVSSISSSYFRMHRRLVPLLLLSIGFTIIILGHLFIAGWLEGIVVPLGGFTIATAHFINYRYVGACKVCNHEAH
ncbi:MerC domain-containing protein [Mucilaginibacter sp. L196]|uniref:MerC domain-containing protein n=1 Tax=Mucilaginibacter sp. L196 TaxID=1641870 RepID=UPI00352E3F72